MYRVAGGMAPWGSMAQEGAHVEHERRAGNMAGKEGGAQEEAQEAQPRRDGGQGGADRPSAGGVQGGGRNRVPGQLERIHRGLGLPGEDLRTPELREAHRRI